jgi:hypothetical protein
MQYCVKYLTCKLAGVVMALNSAGQIRQVLRGRDFVMVEKRPPRWNLVSVCAPIVGYLGAMVAVAVRDSLGYQSEPIIDGLAFSVWAVFCVFGLVAAGVSLFRRERFWGLAAMGIVLNAPLPLLVLYFMLS